MKVEEKKEKKKWNKNRKQNKRRQVTRSREQGGVGKKKYKGSGGNRPLDRYTQSAHQSIANKRIWRHVVCLLMLTIFTRTNASCYSYYLALLFLSYSSNNAPRLLLYRYFCPSTSLLGVIYIMNTCSMYTLLVGLEPVHILMLWRGLLTYHAHPCDNHNESLEFRWTSHWRWTLRYVNTSDASIIRGVRCCQK